MSLDESTAARAVTAQDVAAMQAAANIIDSGQAGRDARVSAVRTGADSAEAGVSPLQELERGRILDMRTDAGEPLHVSVQRDSVTGTLRPLAETNQGSPAEQASAFWSSVMLDREYSSSLAQQAYADQGSIGHIVNYTA